MQFCTYGKIYLLHIKLMPLSLYVSCCTSMDASVQSYSQRSNNTHMAKVLMYGSTGAKMLGMNGYHR